MSSAGLDRRPAEPEGSSALPLALAGESVLLLAQRALFWAAPRTLLVADLHLGKASAFAAGGVPVPSGGARADLDRLAALLARTGARRLVILGDLLHARASRDRATLEELDRWRRRHQGLEVILIRGNHDDKAGDPPAELGFDAVDEPKAEPPFELRHYPPESSPGGVAPRAHVLCGHLHPAVTLRGPGGLRERAACFVVGPGRTILPAFGSFTGACARAAGPRDRLFVVGGDEILEVGPGALRDRGPAESAPGAEPARST